MFEVFRFIYNLVYIDRRPSRLALKLFVGRMATFEWKEKSVSLKLFSSFFFQAEDGIRDAQESRGLGDVYKRQLYL